MAGSIQGDINQALGTLGALATFSPQLQEHAENMAENRKLNKRQKALDAKIEAATSSGKELTPEVEEDLAKEARDIAKRRFELKPSAETYEAYNQELSRLDKMSQAMSRVGRQSEAKKTQKDSMRRYIEELPTDLGGKVKDLDPTLREQIISKYMEANDGKQE